MESRARTEPIPSQQNDATAGADAEAAAAGARGASLFKDKCAALFQDKFQTGIEGLSYSFAPCWDSRRNRITSFACGEFETATSPGFFEYCGPTAATAQCEIDVMALAAAVRGVHYIRSRNELAFVTVPVHCETLAWTKTRAAYLGVLSQVEPSLLPFLSPRITGFQQEYNLYTTAPRFSEFRRYVRWTFVQLPHLNFKFSDVLPLGATGFGISINSLRPPGSLPQVLRAESEKLIGICARQNAIACVNGVESAQDVYLLKSCGIRVISGPAIGKSTEMPSSVDSQPFLPDWPDQGSEPLRH